MGTVDDLTIGHILRSALVMALSRLLLLVTLLVPEE
jgi:hypothetical protein